MEDENRRRLIEALTLGERVEQTFGMKPDATRGAILPGPSFYGGDSRNPSNYGIAAPQWLYEMAKALVLPGHVAAGGSWTNEDALNFALTTAGGGGAVGVRTAPRGALAMGGSKRAGNDVLKNMKPVGPRRLYPDWDTGTAVRRISEAAKSAGFDVSSDLAGTGSSYITLTKGGSRYRIRIAGHGKPDYSAGQYFTPEGHLRWRKMGEWGPSVRRDGATIDTMHDLGPQVDNVIAMLEEMAAKK